MYPREDPREDPRGDPRIGFNWVPLMRSIGVYRDLWGLGLKGCFCVLVRVLCFKVLDTHVGAKAFS